MLRDLKQRFVDGLILASLRPHRRPRLRTASGGGAGDRDRPPDRRERRVDSVRAELAARAPPPPFGTSMRPGRRRIAFVNGPLRTQRPGSSRRLGYLDGLRSCGLAAQRPR